jgi:hypothetical protein
VLCVLVVVTCLQLCVCVCACMCVVLYILFCYALFSYSLISPFQTLPVNQQMYLCDTFRLIAVCPNYYLCPFPLPSPPAALCLRAISIDVWVGGLQGECGKKLGVSKLCLFIFVFNIRKVMLSNNKCYDNSEYPAMRTFPQLVFPKTCNYVKLHVIPNAKYYVISV